jgi:ATP-dependent Clp protease adapter protein ClpS
MPILAANLNPETYDQPHSRVWLINDQCGLLQYVFSVLYLL